MGALDKFKALFFGSTPQKKVKPKQNKRPKPPQKNHLSLVQDNAQNHKLQEKQEIRALQAKISQQIARDPKLAANAALIIEKMLNKK